MKSTSVPDRKTLQITAQLRTDVALRMLLLNELAIMEFSEVCFIQQQDAECLHDYRVALRRSRIVLTRIQGVFPVREVRLFSGKLSRLGQVTGRCRDLDVCLQNWPEYVAITDAANQLIFDYLQQQQHILRTNLINELCGQKYSLFKKRWRDFLSAEPAATRMPNAKIPVCVMANKQMDNALHKITRNIRLINTDSSDRKFHKLRIVCKRLRYLLDYFNELNTNVAYVNLMPEIKKLQDKLGVYQDLIVHRTVMVSIERQMTASGLMDDNVRYAMHAINSVLNERVRVQRAVAMESIKKFLRSDVVTNLLTGN